MYNKMRLFVAALLMLPVMACHAQQEEFVAGKDYTYLPQPVNMNSNKIVVTEIFWYGCGHCYNFERSSKEWRETLGDDVKFEPQPVMWGQPLRELHARAYYTGKALKISDKIDTAMFEGINLKRQMFQSENEIAKVFVDAGVSPDKFSKTFSSFGINSQIAQAQAREKAFLVRATPEIVVNGQYKVTTNGGHQRMMEVTSYLVDKIRKERAAEQTASQ